MIAIFKSILLKGASAKQNKQLVNYENFDFERQVNEIILVIQVLIGCVTQGKLNVTLKGGDIVDVSAYRLPNFICKLINMSTIYLNTSAQSGRKALLKSGAGKSASTPIISPFEVKQFFDDWYKYDNEFTGQDWTLSDFVPNYSGELVSNINSICIVDPTDQSRHTFEIGDGSNDSEAYSFMLDMVATVPLDLIYREVYSMTEMEVEQWFLDNRTK